MSLKRDPSASPIPGTPAWDAQFGVGWKVYVVTSLGVVIVCFVCLVAAATPIERVRWLSVVIVTFLASFIGALGYQLVNGIGIPLGFYRGERLIVQRVLHPTTHPLGYPLFVAGLASLFLAAIGGAAWMYLHAGSVADYLLTHAER